MKVYALIPSGGSGTRTKLSMPKQYVKFDKKELIAYTLEVFQNSELVDEIIIAAQPDYFALVNDIKEKYNFNKISSIVSGGLHRQDSVYNALNSLNCNDDDLIVIHDAARPLLPPDILEKSIKTAFEFDSVVVAIEAKDTLMKGEVFVVNYLDRKNIYYVQTPQIFKYRLLYDSMISAMKENIIGTDESMLVNRSSNKVKIVEGSSLNFKVTTESDLELFKKIIAK